MLEVYEKELLSSPDKPAIEHPSKRPRNTDFGNVIKLHKAAELPRKNIAQATLL